MPDLYVEILFQSAGSFFENLDLCQIFLLNLVFYFLLVRVTEMLNRYRPKGVQQFNLKVGRTNNSFFRFWKPFFTQFFHRVVLYLEIFSEIPYSFFTFETANDAECI